MPSAPIPDSALRQGQRDDDRASSPETIVDGQHADATSGWSFLRRAQARFSGVRSQPSGSDLGPSSVDNEPLLAAGDKPLLGGKQCLQLPPHDEAVVLLDLYFDVCVATYRIIFRPSIDWTLTMAEANAAAGRSYSTNIGSAKTAILYSVLAIATFHTQKAAGFSDDKSSLCTSDDWFSAAVDLTSRETGIPKLESVQARLLQVFYLLMTCRMHRAWYVFGEVLQLIPALGMHRSGRRAVSSDRRSGDYILSQCRRRLFWTAYILDKYLGVVLGRPNHFHDEDISLELPDSVNDEDMTEAGPVADHGSAQNDCQLDAFVFNAKLAQIVGVTSRQLYPLHPIKEGERLNRLRNINLQLDKWKSQLPAFLGSVRPSTLIRSFRRQSIALKIAYSHAVMHANRTSLLASASPDGQVDEVSINRCIDAAEEVLEIVDTMASEGPLFHAFWWSHYVLFCALSVVLVWELQSLQLGHEVALRNGGSLFDLAHRCQHHLANATATNSPGRRYTIILDELRADIKAAKIRIPRQQQSYSLSTGVAELQEGGHSLSNDAILQQHEIAVEDHSTAQDWLRDWNVTDWMDLDAMAFGHAGQFSPASFDWLGSME
ncbi:hypothetical protein PRZ48_014811 [Zasmidium cellare]|uniref:Xylanolytic transcriptional activator regulatory domain-containing protein n=1 Tax=Zasmidium cellare TaxID=395010 RepID=A0ABR0DZV1_ZASCE|nr:hypothetical protein PRZ48_014811 [Zasmidium cellare]